MSFKDFLTLLIPFNKKDYIVLGNVSPFLLNLPYKISTSYQQLKDSNQKHKPHYNLHLHQDEHSF